MHTRNSERTSPLIFEHEIERVVRRNLANRLEATLASDPPNTHSPLTLSVEPSSMDPQNSNHPNNQYQFQYQGNLRAVQNIPQDQPGGGNNSRPPTPRFQNRGHNNNQRTPTPPHPNSNRQNPLPTNINDRNVNSDHRGNRDRGNPANEDPFFNVDDLRNEIPDDEPYSVPGYQSPEHVSIHSEYSDDGGNYDEREDDGWGYVNRGNVYNARGFEDDEFGYQNANYVGNDNYGYGDGNGNVRNDKYENNRNLRNNNQRNRDDGYYNNNNNPNCNWIPRFVGGGNQGGYQGGNRRDNRRPREQEVDGPRRNQQPPRGVNDRFRPVVTDNDSPTVCE
ncbi:probable cyclin-dependent serine/threonine-protein kinase DDB_G0292550 [Helianthus annuus]|uniref:probable cyclin-dependent serine/threonine-protein kinase DDB_G0292550 n=1 Tax=Helianthus annuus TaxID=4232 RepID=UPI000B903721|nr:probable cyclin-dependent serine/threonine-protein kinase DDB_G0292550 [Helianthus annuus]